MDQKALSNWLKLILAGMGLCGLVVYAAVLPWLGLVIAQQNPEMSHRFWPWLIFLWTTGLPCYIALFCGWRVASNIGRDRSFSQDNARLLKWISLLAAGDAAFFFAGNAVLLLLSLSHPGVALFSLLGVFAGVAVSAAAAALSHLVRKAADLQEQSDWTI